MPRETESSVLLDCFSSTDMLMKLPQQTLHVALSLVRVHYTVVGCGMIGILW